MTAEDFWKRVDVGDPSECWEWQGVIESHGYGRVCSPSGVGWPRCWRTHRLAFFFHYGVNPGQSFVLHSCDNPACCNPHHLRLGNQKDNMRDRAIRGRANLRKGVECKNAKLTDDLVAKMRQQFSPERYGDFTKAAKQFGVSRQLATEILRGNKWRHVQ